ncbi:hatching enzyme 1.2-like [Lampris incognitus]|uniref:hatching enzyme 1.2-like n=1 Tax=Lampris incognitus TaxID=2546036 RepID=UPI0024B60C74|nr:hatching enzyme 1.2-like [Lampris incognitus]
MTSALLFLLLSLMSSAVFSLPPGATNKMGGTKENLIDESEESSVSDMIEAVNANLGNVRGGPRIIYGDIAMSTSSRNAVPCTAKGCKWRKYGRYVYVPVFISYSYSRAERNVIIRALVSFHRTSCIRFVWRKRQRDYIYFYPGNGCWSRLGRQGRWQLISLQKRGCVNHGTVQHEVLHALGFHHEQVRSDRDRYVTIKTENILPGREHNFRKVQTNNLATPYDYNSVMHYGRYAFSKARGRLPTIVPKPNPNVSIGGARAMSRNDINRVNRLYQCW